MGLVLVPHLTRRDPQLDNQNRESSKSEWENILDFAGYVLDLSTQPGLQSNPAIHAVRHRHFGV
jgi:hypothetical protein